MRKVAHHLHLLLVVVAVWLTSCEKELDIDYHDTDQLYVVEAATTDTGTKVIVSRTVGMDEGKKIPKIGMALVVISTADGVRDTAEYHPKGYYYSSLCGVPGTTYHLDVSVEDQHFSSYSVMQRQPVLNGFRMVWKEMFDKRLLFGELRIQDFPNEENYYYVHVFRNGYGYRWTVFRDTGSPGEEIKQIFGCCREDDIDSSSDLSDTDVICEDDNIYIEVRAIDRRTYDYLASMETMDSAGSNPIANFTGGCLGYYSAYIPSAVNYVFHRSDVVMAED